VRLPRDHEPGPPTGKGQQRWSSRWKVAFNAFEIAFEAPYWGLYHLPRTGLLFLVGGAPQSSPKTGLATENGVKPNLLTCENVPL
jgi:hypothetical protein